MSTPTTLPAPAPAVGKVWAKHRWAIIRISSPVVLLVLWQILSATGFIPEEVLPAPQLILDAGLELIQNGKLVEALEVSGLGVLEGLALGGFIGVALGVAVGLSRWFEATVDPPLQMVRALPHLGLIPLFILWFGIGELPKVLLVALGVSFPLYLNTYSAIKQATANCWKPLMSLVFRSGSGCASSSCRAPHHRSWWGCVNRWLSRG